MNDDWVIENLRVTLFSPKHKERVILQNNRDDLRITTRESEESIRQDVPDKATVDKKAARKEGPAPEAKAARAAAPSTAATANPPPPPTPPPPTPPPPETPERTSSSLKWEPTEDAGYTGYSAESRGGDFVLLKTKRSLWALYFSWGRGVHVGLGCFRELKDGKVAAQKQHDEGPVPRPNGKITVEMVEKACPAPPEPEPEPPAAAAPPEPAAAPTTVPFDHFAPKPPRRTRAKKSAAEPESTPAPEVQKPASEAPNAQEIEVDPDEAKKMLGQLKGLLDQEN